MTPKERAKKIKAEHTRLLGAFADADPGKLIIFDAHLMEMARLRIEIDEMAESVQKTGPVKVSKKNPAKQKTTEAARQLTRSRAALINISKLLVKELGGMEDDDSGLEDYE